MISCSALVLAGGQSSRMGRDKALLTVDGIPLLQRVYTAARAAFDQKASIYVMTAWPERYQSLDLNVHFLPESQPTQGPLMALAQAFDFINSDWILVLACDLPWLDPWVLRTWILELDQIAPEILACVPHAAQGWDPLCGLYRSTCQASLVNYLDQGDRSFQGWLNQIPVQKLSVADPRMLFNCNTPEDLGSCL